ncbi:hypothetical protein [Mesorhizobium huakuii]|uniref:Uncharacterized protein n=1 Tax=Mesorhizobium huakuii TaxID=28104 RepID=A0A7G6SQ19_9HYPH|nr:hypothetical protein [Mesorhizobium huakuii]QND56601.1 hypothetical protein HB778_08240 [Mesorhizobium huakuii]
MRKVLMGLVVAASVLVVSGAAAIQPANAASCASEKPKNRIPCLEKSIAKLSAALDTANSQIAQANAAISKLREDENAAHAALEAKIKAGVSGAIDDKLNRVNIVSASNANTCLSETAVASGGTAVFLSDCTHQEQVFNIRPSH